MVWWLYHERGILVSQPTISRTLKCQNWTWKTLKCISRNHSEALWRSYLDDIHQFLVEDLVFLDESIFNEKTGWRHFGYTPIGDEARYPADLWCGNTWSICAAMMLDGWLPCMNLKQGYFSANDFFSWIQDHLLPNLDAKGHPMVVVLDNVSIHVSQRVTEAVERGGHLIHFLPPYSPDLNPIELTFSVLKAWIKLKWVFLHQTCGSFGDFLELAVRESQCDHFARQHFQHSGGRGVYIEEEELIKFKCYMESFQDSDALDCFITPN